MMSMAAMANQFQAQQQAQSAQNKLRDLYQDPDNTDDQGNLNTNALKQIMQVDPNVGMQVQHNQLRNRQAQLQMQMLTSDTFSKQMDMGHKVQLDARLAYEDVLKNGGQEQQAREAGQKILDEGVGEMRSSGAIPEQMMKQFRTQFDPNDFSRMDAKYLQYQKLKADIELAKSRMAQQQQFHQDTVKREDERLGLERREQLNRDVTTDARLKALAAGGKKTPAEQDAETIANANIETRSKELGRPLTPAEQAQARVDARIAPKLQETRQKQELTAISDEAAESVVDRIVAGDPRATMNLGRGQATMKKVEDALAKRRADGKISAGQLLAAQATVRADTSSLANLTKMTDAATSFETTASKNFDLALSLADKAIPTNWGPFVNKWVMDGERALGDKDVPPYVAAMLTGANEYAKIMSGSTGAQGSTVDSRREAAELFSPYLSRGQIKEVVAVAKKDMANRKSSLNDQLAVIKERLGSSGEKKPDTEKQDTKPQQSAAPAPADFKSAQDVKQAYQAGKISREDAARVLHDQFNIR